MKKLWETMTRSRLNICISLASFTLIAMIAVIMAIVLTRDDGSGSGTKKTQSSTEKAETETTAVMEDDEEETEEFTTVISETETQNLVPSTSMLEVKARLTRSWTDGDDYYIQYDFTVTNISGSYTNSWALMLDMRSFCDIVDTWNFNFKNRYGKIIVTPTNENRSIEDGDSVTGGLIIKSDSYVYIDYITVYVGDSVETIRLQSAQTSTTAYIPPTTVEDPFKEMTTEPETETETESDSETETAVSESTTQEVTDVEDTDVNVTDVEVTTQESTVNTEHVEEATTLPGSEETN